VRSRATAKPIGEIAHTLPAQPRGPSSSAIPPPSELPTACGRSRPELLHRGGERLDGRRAAERRDSPKPGRSTAITSCSRASSGHHRIPDAAVQADAVHQHDRRAVSAGVLEHAPRSYD
jgi:hypothetical protein